MKYLKRFRLFENLTIKNFNDDLKTAVEDGEITSVNGFFSELIQKIIETLENSGFKPNKEGSRTGDEMTITAEGYTFEIVLEIDRYAKDTVRVMYRDDDPNDPDKQILELESDQETYGRDGTISVSFEFDESGGVSIEVDSFESPYEKYEEDNLEIKTWDDKVIERLLKNIERVKK
jgi:hypothetical protein